MSKLDEAYKELESLFIQVYQKQGADTFTQFLNYCMYVVSMKHVHEPFNEQCSQEFNRMFILIGEGAEVGSDFLGMLFESNVSKGLNGQFFTPDSIADFMVEINMQEIHDGMTVCDPACGSGRMLLAAHRKALRQNKRIKAFGSDIDHACVKMAVINCFINSIFGEIAWMNALSLDFYKAYRISKGFFNFPVLHVIDEKEDSVFYVRSKTDFTPEVKQEIKQTYIKRGCDAQQLSLF